MRPGFKSQRAHQIGGKVKKQRTRECDCGREVKILATVNRCRHCGSEFDREGKCTLPRWSGEDHET
jgi:hypothetical protein